MALSGTLDPAGGRSGGFGAARRPSLRGLALTAAAHVALVPLALSLSYQVSAIQKERLVTMNLSSPQSSPPPAPPSPPQQQPAESAEPAGLTVPPVPFALADAGPVVPARADLPAFPTSAPMPAPAPARPAAAPAMPAPAAPPSVISSGSLDATFIAGEPPRYPHESRRRKEQGTVALMVIVGTDGRVETISVAASSGSRRLDDAALKAVSGWRWQPQRAAGQPVKVRGIVEIPFVLTSARKAHHRADCDSPDPHCRTGDSPADRDRPGRMGRRHGDVGIAGPDGEE